MGTLPAISVRHLSGVPTRPLLVVGPSLGTSVERLWGPVAARLQGWNVLGWDLPGHGHTPPPDRLTDGFSMAELARAVLRAVDEAAGTGRPFAVAGDSVGGAVGLHLALDHPERISHLAVLCSAAAFVNAPAYLERAGLVRRAGMAQVAATAPARWFGSAILRAEDDRCAAVVGDLENTDPEGYARVCEAIAGHDVHDRLRQIEAPVLAVAGADDTATPPAVVEQVARGVARGHLEVLDGVGHLAPYEDPEATAALLTAFLGAAGTD